MGIPSHFSANFCKWGGGGGVILFVLVSVFSGKKPLQKGVTLGRIHS